MYCYTIEKKDSNGPCHLFVGDSEDKGCMDIVVVWSKSYKFYDRQSAESFMKFISFMFNDAFFDPNEYEVTEHEEVNAVFYND